MKGLWFSCVSLLGKYFYSTQLQKSVGKKFFRYKTVGLFILRSYKFVWSPIESVCLSQSAKTRRRKLVYCSMRPPPSAPTPHTQSREKRKRGFVYLSHCLKHSYYQKVCRSAENEFVSITRTVRACVRVFLCVSVCAWTLPHEGMRSHFSVRGIQLCMGYIDWKYAVSLDMHMDFWHDNICMKWRQPATVDDYYNSHKLGDNEIMKIVQPQQIHLQCINVYYHFHTHINTHSPMLWKRGSMDVQE